MDSTSALHVAAPTADAAPTPPGWWVACLCAGWCGVCRDYRSVFDQLAASHPGVHFEWVDVEDEEHIPGDLDVETFPTVLIADGAAARFLGPVLPQAGVLGRMLSSLQDGPTGASDPVAQGVFERLRTARG